MNKKLLLIILGIVVLVFAVVLMTRPPVEEPRVALQQVVAGSTHSLAIKTDGTLWAWGSNEDGSLGLDDARIRVRYFPTQVGIDTDWQSIVAGSGYTLAIKTDGTLWAWGRNRHGQLGLGDTEDRHSPIQVGTDNDWASVTAGSFHSLAIKTDGTLWSWGSNTLGERIQGQLGLGEVEGRHSPTQVGTDNDWASVTAGSTHSLAIKTDSTLWAWGSNSWGSRIHGQLGLSDKEYLYFPIQVGTDNNWQLVVAGDLYTLAIKTDSTLWAWGSNSYYGKLGLGDLEDRHSPNQVGVDTDWQFVAAGSDYALAIKKDGSLWAWGRNSGGQLGLGHTTNRYAPTKVGTDNDWQSVAAGSSHSLAIKTDGTLWAWGKNWGGILGLGHIVDRHFPTQVIVAKEPLLEEFLVEKIPVYPDAFQLEMSEEWEEDMKLFFPQIIFVALYISEDSQEEIGAWYKAQLVEAGWEKEEEINEWELPGTIWRKNDTILEILTAIITEEAIEDVPEELAEIFIGVKPGMVWIMHSVKVEPVEESVKESIEIPKVPAH